MTTSAPPRPSEPVEALAEQVEPSALQEEALIEEARQRASRRRRRYGACALLVAAIVASAAFAFGKDRGADGSVADTHGRAAGTASPLPRNGPLSIVSAGPTDGSGGGIYEVGDNGLGRRVFQCGPSTRCWELEGAAWSPDGRYLAYGVESIGGAPAYDGLYVLDVASGTSRQVLQFDLNGERGGWYETAWSPDGKTIAYVSPRDDCCRGSGRIYLIRPDGTHRRILPTGAGSAEWPTWSPDGRRIAYATAQVNGRSNIVPLNGSIYVMRTDGSHRTLVATRGTAPAWSPDGTRIAYLSGCGPPPLKPTKATGIRFVTPAGHDVTHSPVGEGCPTLGVAGAPAWAPDGSKIAMANKTGVYLMDADGSNLHQLASGAPTSVAANSLSWSRPAWQPLP